MDSRYTNEITILTEEEKDYILDFFQTYFVVTSEKTEAYSWHRLEDYLKLLFKARESRLIRTYYSMDMCDNTLLRYIANHYVDNGVQEYVNTIIENDKYFYYIKTSMSLDNILTSVTRRMIVDDFLNYNE